MLKLRESLEASAALECQEIAAAWKGRAPQKCV
jgi:hypothetical protein